MKSHPWHLRVPKLEHYQWYQNLRDFHQLTLGFASLNSPPNVTLEFADKVPAGLQEISLDRLVDERSVQEMLEALEQTLWANQATTLMRVSSLESELEQKASEIGKACFNSRWNGVDYVKIAKLNDLREILLCLRDSPFSGYPHGDGFFLKRATAQEVQIELQFCPHRIHYPEIKAVADSLCRLHSEWMLGFVQELNPKIHLKHSLQAPRCLQRWSFGP